MEPGPFKAKNHADHESVSIGIKIPYRLKKDLMSISIDEERSVANLIHYILKQYVKEYRA